MARKFLWLISMGSGGTPQIVQHAQNAGADAVCVRTSNPSLPAAIPVLHAAGIQVYGWRWPAVTPTPHSTSHYYAIDEANYVVTQLIAAGLDGYIVDPESDHPHDINDWNQSSLASLAQKFCAAIKGGAVAAGKPGFRFGVTSGCSYPNASGKPFIPWAEFVAASDALYPQTYWRWTNPETGNQQGINGGSPAAAITAGRTSWGRIAEGKPIIPMAGELDVITGAEIATYGMISAEMAGELHFFADTDHVPATNYTAIKNL
jgi:hypothetical protein